MEQKSYLFNQILKIKKILGLDIYYGLRTISQIVHRLESGIIQICNQWYLKIWKQPKNAWHPKFEVSQKVAKFFQTKVVELQNEFRLSQHEHISEQYSIYLRRARFPFAIDLQLQFISLSRASDAGRLT